MWAIWRWVCGKSSVRVLESRQPTPAPSGLTATLSGHHQNLSHILWRSTPISTIVLTMQGKVGVVAKMRLLTASAVLGSVFWAAQGVMGQERTGALCDDGVSGGCAAGTVYDATLTAHPPSLFAPASDAARAALTEPSTTPSVAEPRSRHQAVQIDFAQLSRAREALADGRGAGLTVNLPDLPLPVVFATASETRRGYALSGRVANDPFSAVNIVVNGRSVAGNIRRAGELHTIRTAGAGHYVQTLDSLTIPRCEAEQFGQLDRETAQALRLQDPAIAHVTQNDGAEDDGSEIDVLVVYTPSGRRSAGGHEGVRTLMELLVQETNQAYSDSDVRQRIRLVATTEVDYALEDFDLRQALRHLTGKDDGHMDEVHQIRDLYAADLVLLFRPFGGGTAWLAEDPPAATAERFGFSVSNWHVFAHELGHNMGLMHGRSSDPGNLPYPYSHGYTFRHRGVQYATIMATASEFLRFSNPRQLYPNDLGVPMGVPGDTPTSSPDGPADAARSLNETASAIANFRSSSAGCQYDLPSPKDVAVQGGQFVISVETTANCSWETRSLAPGLSITEGFNGTGSGQVAFNVEENLGWAREVALRVGGEVYSFRQEGRRQAVAACDRSSGVREAISAALDGRPCDDIAAEDLAGIGSLEINGSVSLGDFDGLTGLGDLVLRLYPQRVPRLERGIFAGAGLENLHSLSLLGAATKELHLQRGVFEGLGALEGLRLYSVSWDPGVFEDVPSLIQLETTHYPRSVLPDGAFRGLRNVRYLFSDGAYFETVGARAFQGLSSLRQLSFIDGHLTHLPRGSFEDLPELFALVLRRNRLTAIRRDQFRGAQDLTYIDLRDNPVRVVESRAFRGLRLEHLDLRNSDLTALNLDVFGELVNCTLDLSGNRLTTLAPGVFSGAGLYRLDLSNNDISDVRFLSGLSYAREVDLSGNGIVDVSPLSSISGLRTLDLSGNRIVDISPLASLSDELTYLDLSHNEIRDISSLLARDGPMGGGDSLFLHENPLLRSALDDHIGVLRSWGVDVSTVRVWPMDSSALEGDEFEFPVRLSAEVNRPVSMDWHLIFAEQRERPPTFAGALLTATTDDFDGWYWEGRVIRYKPYTGGELTIGAMRRVGYATVPGASVESAAWQSAEEEHETVAFVLLPGASRFPNGVALDASSPPVLRELLGVARYSAAVGLIVDADGPSHDVALFLAHGDARERESVLRLVHPMDGSPAHVEVFDSLGRRQGATTLSTKHATSVQRPEPSRRAVAQFNSDDLENGNHDSGLSKGIGPGGSDWRLKVWANDVQALSYVRHADGFLTSMHDVAPQQADGAYAVPIFNPASQMDRRSILRLVNPGTEATEVRIVGTDDAGERPGEAMAFRLSPAACGSCRRRSSKRGRMISAAPWGTGRASGGSAWRPTSRSWWRICLRAPPDI